MPAKNKAIKNAQKVKSKQEIQKEAREVKSIKEIQSIEVLAAFLQAKLDAYTLIENFDKDLVRRMTKKITSLEVVSKKSDEVGMHNKLKEEKASSSLKMLLEEFESAIDAKAKKNKPENKAPDTKAEIAEKIADKPPGSKSQTMVKTTVPEENLTLEQLIKKVKIAIEEIKKINKDYSLYDFEKPMYAAFMDRLITKERELNEIQAKHKNTSTNNIQNDSTKNLIADVDKCIKSTKDGQRARENYKDQRPTIQMPKNIEEKQKLKPKGINPKLASLALSTFTPKKSGPTNKKFNQGANNVQAKSKIKKNKVSGPVAKTEVIIKNPTSNAKETTDSAGSYYVIQPSKTTRRGITNEEKNVQTPKPTTPKPVTPKFQETFDLHEIEKEIISPGKLTEEDLREELKEKLKNRSKLWFKSYLEAYQKTHLDFLKTHEDISTHLKLIIRQLEDPNIYLHLKINDSANVIARLLTAIKSEKLNETNEQIEKVETEEKETTSGQNIEDIPTLIDESKLNETSPVSDFDPLSEEKDKQSKEEKEELDVSTLNEELEELETPKSKKLEKTFKPSVVKILSPEELENKTKEFPWVISYLTWVVSYLKAYQNAHSDFLKKHDDISGHLNLIIDQLQDPQVPLHLKIDETENAIVELLTAINDEKTKEQNEKVETEKEESSKIENTLEPKTNIVDESLIKTSSVTTPPVPVSGQETKKIHNEKISKDKTSSVTTSPSPSPTVSDLNILLKLKKEKEQKEDSVKREVANSDLAGLQLYLEENKIANIDLLQKLDNRNLDKKDVSLNSKFTKLIRDLEYEAPQLIEKAVDQTHKKQFIDAYKEKAVNVIFELLEAIQKDKIEQDQQHLEELLKKLHDSQKKGDKVKNVYIPGTTILQGTIHEFEPALAPIKRKLIRDQDIKKLQIVEPTETEEIEKKELEKEQKRKEEEERIKNEAAEIKRKEEEARKKQLDEEERKRKEKELLETEYPKNQEQFELWKIRYQVQEEAKKRKEEEEAQKKQLEEQKEKESLAAGYHPRNEEHLAFLTIQHQFQEQTKKRKKEEEARKKRLEEEERKREKELLAKQALDPQKKDAEPKSKQEEMEIKRKEKDLRKQLKDQEKQEAERLEKEAEQKRKEEEQKTKLWIKNLKEKRKKNAELKIKQEEEKKLAETQQKNNAEINTSAKSEPDFTPPQDTNTEIAPPETPISEAQPETPISEGQPETQITGNLPNPELYKESTAMHRKPTSNQQGEQAQDKTKEGDKKEAQSKDQKESAAISPPSQESKTPVFKQVDAVDESGTPDIKALLEEDYDAIEEELRKKELDNEANKTEFKEKLELELFEEDLQKKQDEFNEFEGFTENQLEEFGKEVNKPTSHTNTPVAATPETHKDSELEQQEEPPINATPEINIDSELEQQSDNAKMELDEEEVEPDEEEDHEKLLEKARADRESLDKKKKELDEEEDHKKLLEKARALRELFLTPTYLSDKKIKAEKKKAGLVAKEKLNPEKIEDESRKIRRDTDNQLRDYREKEAEELRKNIKELSDEIEKLREHGGATLDQFNKKIKQLEQLKKRLNKDNTALKRSKKNLVKTKTPSKNEAETHGQPTSPTVEPPLETPSTNQTQVEDENIEESFSEEDEITPNQPSLTEVPTTSSAIGDATNQVTPDALEVEALPEISKTDELKKPTEVKEPELPFDELAKINPVAAADVLLQRMRSFQFQFPPDISIPGIGTGQPKPPTKQVDQISPPKADALDATSPPLKRSGDSVPRSPSEPEPVVSGGIGDKQKNEGEEEGNLKKDPPTSPKVRSDQPKEEKPDLTQQSGEGISVQPPETSDAGELKKPTEVKEPENISEQPIVLPLQVPKDTAQEISPVQTPIPEQSKDSYENLDLSNMFDEVEAQPSSTSIPVQSPVETPSTNKNQVLPVDEDEGETIQQSPSEEDQNIDELEPATTQEFNNPQDVLGATDSTQTSSSATQPTTTEGQGDEIKLDQPSSTQPGDGSTTKEVGPTSQAPQKTIDEQDAERKRKEGIEQKIREEKEAERKRKEDKEKKLKKQQDEERKRQVDREKKREQKSKEEEIADQQRQKDKNQRIQEDSDADLKRKTEKDKNSGQTSAPTKKADESTKPIADKLSDISNTGGEAPGKSTPQLIKSSAKKITPDILQNATSKTSVISNIGSKLKTAKAGSNTQGVSQQPAPAKQTDQPNASNTGALKKPALNIHELFDKLNALKDDQEIVDPAKKQPTEGAPKTETPAPTKPAAQSKASNVGEGTADQPKIEPTKKPNTGATQSTAATSNPPPTPPTPPIKADLPPLIPKSNTLNKSDKTQSEGFTFSFPPNTLNNSDKPQSGSIGIGLTIPKWPFSQEPIKKEKDLGTEMFGAYTELLTQFDKIKNLKLKKDQKEITKQVSIFLLQNIPFDQDISVQSEYLKTATRHSKSLEEILASIKKNENKTDKDKTEGDKINKDETDKKKTESPTYLIDISDGPDKSKKSSDTGDYDLHDEENPEDLDEEVEVEEELDLPWIQKLHWEPLETEAYKKDPHLNSSERFKFKYFLDTPYLLKPKYEFQTYINSLKTRAYEVSTDKQLKTTRNDAISRWQSLKAYEEYLAIRDLEPNDKNKFFADFKLDLIDQEKFKKGLSKNEKETLKTVRYCLTEMYKLLTDDKILSLNRVIDPKTILINNKIPYKTVKPTGDDATDKAAIEKALKEFGIGEPAASTATSAPKSSDPAEAPRPTKLVAVSEKQKKQEILNQKDTVKKKDIIITCTKNETKEEGVKFLNGTVFHSKEAIAEFHTDYHSDDPTKNLSISTRSTEDKQKLLNAPRSKSWTASIPHDTIMADAISTLIIFKAKYPKEKNYRLLGDFHEYGSLALDYAESFLVAGRYLREILGIDIEVKIDSSNTDLLKRCRYRKDSQVPQAAIDLFRKRFAIDDKNIYRDRIDLIKQEEIALNNDQKRHLDKMTGRVKEVWQGKPVGKKP